MLDGGGGVCRPRVGLGAPCENVNWNHYHDDSSCDVGLTCEEHDGGARCETMCPIQAG